MALAGATVLVLTGTRYAVLLCVVVATGVLFALTRRARGGRQVVLLAAWCLGIACLVVLATRGAGTITSFLARGQDATTLVTLTGRTDIWAQALSLVPQSPWLGHGYYAGHRIAASALPGTDAELSNLDNMWVETLVDTGAIGAGLLLAICIAVLIRCWSVSRATHGMALRAIFAFFIVASFVNPSIQTVGYGAALFTLVFLLAGNPREPEPQHKDSRPTLSKYRRHPARRMASDSLHSPALSDHRLVAERLVSGS